MNKGLYTILLFFIFSCSYQLKQGKIINKEYEPERTYTSIVLVTTMIGKSCITNEIPVTNYDDEDYILIVEGIDNKGKIIKNKYYVTKEIYNISKIGEHIVFKNDIMSYCDKNKKIKK